jgi:phage shock protein C
VATNLYRSRKDKIIAGVCGGIAEYFKVDSTLIRLAWALSFLMGGAGFFFYIIALIIMPQGSDYGAQYYHVENVAQNNQEEVSKEESPATEGETEDQQRQENEQNGQNHQNQQNKDMQTTDSDEKRSRFIGITFIVLGVYFLLEKLFDIHLHNFWPVLLIALGLYLLFKDKGGHAK